MQSTRLPNPSKCLQRHRTLSHRCFAGGARPTQLAISNGPPRTKSSQARLKVAVDVDEVLAQFLLALNKYCLDELGRRYHIRDYHEYVFANVWKCNQAESNRIVHDFFKSRHFAEEIPPMPGAREALSRISSYADIVVVTSRQHVIQAPTITWLDTHFPDVFQEVHFGNHWSLEGKSRPKSQICKEIGATILIDDNPMYAQECANEGLHVLLYDWENSYPWAKSKGGGGATSKNIRRVANWDEVEASLFLHHTNLSMASASADEYLP